MQRPYDHDFNAGNKICTGLTWVDQTKGGIHRIVDTFARQDESDPRYARMVLVDEIASPKNDYNLNLPRYIDSTEPEDLQDSAAEFRSATSMTPCG